MGVVSLFLGLIALAFSIYQTRESNKQSERLNKQSNSLSMITDSLSTKYIGEFPDYLSTITTLIEKAENEVRIIKTTPVQAYFTKPILWVNYSQALERKVRSGVSIKIICLDENGRKKRLQLQYLKPEEEWNIWKANNINKINEFIRYRHQNVNTELLKSKEFINLLMSTQNELIKESFILKGIEVTEINQIIPVQAWIIDASQAVFTIQTLPLQTVGHAFLTSDPRIVAALHQMTKYFTNETKKDYDMYTRIDNIVVTKDLDKSINLYKDFIELEMRSLSNPVLIFKYDFTSLYVYKDSFFKEQFGIDANSANGMISIELNSKDDLNTMKTKLKTKNELCEVFKESENRFFIKDFNNLIVEFWYNFQNGQK